MSAYGKNWTARDLKAGWCYTNQCFAWYVRCPDGTWMYMGATWEEAVHNIAVLNGERS
jgi:hypothetical protein